MKFCECGCGEKVRNRFVNGHHIRLNNPGAFKRGHKPYNVGNSRHGYF